VITLYSWGTPNGNKLHIMLEELGDAYELVPINLGSGEQRAPEFLQINPNGKIPAIIDAYGPNGKPLALFESGAILIYLAEKTGRFLPDQPADRYRAMQWIMFQMGGVGPIFGQLHHFKASAPKPVPYAIERYTREGERLLKVLDDHLTNCDYLVGSQYSIADICTWPWVRSWVYTLNNSIEPWSNVVRWYQSIERRPAVVNAIEIYDRLRATGRR
jgi:GST-like protein